METNSAQLPEIGFLRLKQIIGDKRQGTPAIVPVSKSSWYSGMITGKYPRPVLLGKKAVAWRLVDIRALVEQMGGDEGVAR